MLRRALVLALALAFLAPLTAANQAPVPIPLVQGEARLLEPVVFTHASLDPDGAIVSVAWTFSDGRTLLGDRVTKAFDWPGIHTTQLEVADDHGARAVVDVQVLVHATLMHGRAVALAGVAGSHADTGDVVTPYHTDTVRSVGAADQGQLRVAALDADLKTFSDRAVARANVGYVHIPVPVGFIHITGVEAEAVMDCGQEWRFSDVGKIRLNDAPIVPPGAVPPNTRVDVPGVGTILLNVQDPPAADRIGVTAVRVLLPNQAPIDIGHAEAGVSFCPWTP